MIHLTQSGFRGDRPLCRCHRASHQAMGDTFLAIEYASSTLLDSDELCLACRSVVNAWEEGDPTPIEWLDVEEIPPSIATTVG